VPPKVPAQVVNGLSEGGILPDGQANAVDGMKDGRVIAIANPSADLGKAVIGQLTREVHGDLASRGNLRSTITVEHMAAVHPELHRGRVQDLSNARDPRRARVA
jgi:hypothetical protein